MDYTKIPRKLLYKEKKDLEEFMVNDEKTMDGEMFKAIQKSSIILLDGASKYVLEIFNTTYYIVTMILLERYPILYMTKYLDIADKIGSAPNSTNTFHTRFKCMTMAMVSNYIRALNPNHFDVDAFQTQLDDYFAELSHYRSEKREIRNYTNSLLDFFTVSSFDVHPDRFLPRPIIGALDECYCRDVCENVDYIKPRIMELEADQMKAATQKFFERMIYLGDELPNDDLNAEVNFAKEAMEEVLIKIDPKYIPLSERIKNFESYVDDYMKRHTITEEEIDEICSDDNAPTDTSSGEKDEIIRRQQETINEQQKRIKELEDIVASSSGGAVVTKPDWIDWFDDDVFKPNFNAEKIAEAIKVIVAPHLSTHCYWYVVFRVLGKICWLADGATQKAFLKWANAHFSLGWKGEQQFKFSEINDSIKKVADIDDWDKYTMKTNQGQYYAELRDKLYKVFVEKLPNGKLFDRTEFIKQGQLRVNNGH